MKQGIHPKWNHQSKVTCACGNVFYTGSQQDEIRVDICSACHPFFTGEMRFVDRQGRVDRFMQKMNEAKEKQAAAAAKRKAKSQETEAAPAEETQTKEPLSYKQVLQNEQNKMKNVSANRGTAAKAA